MGTYLSLSKSTTSISLDISEIALLVFGVLLVVGLVGEYAESEKWKRYVKTFEMFVILGVAGELFADGGVFLFSSHLQTIAEQEIAEVTKRAGDAKDSAIKAADAATVAKAAADAAGIEAGKAETSAGVAIGKSDRANAAAGKALSTSRAATDAASEAQEKVGAVAERAEGLDRAIRQTQYWLDSLRVTDRDSLVKALGTFKGQKIDFVSYAGDPGGDMFCNELLNAAYSAGIDPTNRCGVEPAIAPRPGIIQMGLLVSGPNISETNEIGGILANNTNCPAGSGVLAPKLTVLVGFHPPFTMDKTRVFKPPANKQTNKQNTKP